MEKRIKPGQKVIVALRRMIASGELRDGERIGEIATAERLGVSRMPVRTALRMLEQEGLVVKLGARGYAARGITVGQIEGAIEVRGALEGLAARRLALQGLDRATDKALSLCLQEGDALFAKGYLADGDLERFYAYNLRLHDLLTTASGNPAIGIALSRNNHLPFASPAALALDWDDLAAEFDHLSGAHREHHAVVDAIRSRDADKAEQLMRAHAHAATGNTRIFERLNAAQPAHIT
jgi:GntR family transcriptional regulator of vanillate catabolism